MHEDFHRSVPVGCSVHQSRERDELRSLFPFVCTCVCVCV